MAANPRCFRTPLIYWQSWRSSARAIHTPVLVRRPRLLTRRRSAGQTRHPAEHHRLIFQPARLLFCHRPGAFYQTHNTLSARNTIISPVSHAATIQPPATRQLDALPHTDGEKTVADKNAGATPRTRLRLFLGRAKFRCCALFLHKTPQLKRYSTGGFIEESKVKRLKIPYSAFHSFMMSI
ncbi:hypothetical protein KCP74_11850 [Salmonella enterica subsp. enterica]|nr:hypothetical protein KCP74_11850 [Salmonella enterica subsp. enterica]